MNNRKEPKQFDDGCSDFFDRYLVEGQKQNPKYLVESEVLKAVNEVEQDIERRQLIFHQAMRIVDQLLKMGTISLIPNDGTITKIRRWSKLLNESGVNSKKQVREEMEEILKSLEK